jgi:hypothetical protein
VVFSFIYIISYFLKKSALVVGLRGDLLDEELEAGNADELPEQLFVSGLEVENESCYNRTKNY